jgi:SpoIID/LytB domain protein
MSQYGAQGLALHGSTYDEILARYYSGTTVRSWPTQRVRVLLASGRSSVTAASDGSFSFAGRTLSPGTYTVRPSAGRISVTGNGTTITAASPATFAPRTKSPLELDRLPYRGDLLVAVAPSGTRLEVANRLGLEDYLRGVVPREMPASWRAEALKTQAVAARTYALATGGHCTWNGLTAFCADTGDQVYGGKSAETSATSTAVLATAGEAVAYEEPRGTWHLATTYFFSTSGGKTCAARDCFGTDVFYLRSVDDPFDSISPHHFWGPLDAEPDCTGTSPDCVYTAAQLTQRLALPESPRDTTVAVNASGRVASLQVKGATTTTGVAGGRSYLAEAAARTDVRSKKSRRSSTRRSGLSSGTKAWASGTLSSLAFGKLAASRSA